jgi:alkanesulfonate monooxygenase SsuD/methylene tetrahydromethanopterin reductase-like flavin-dependent oxidoreductase (luciferase family)
VALVALRYDLRSAPFAATKHPELYAACLEQSAWGDRNGLDVITLSEHHGLEDGYLPSPFTMAAAVAARTNRIAITIAAAILTLHDPIRLAEEIAVADLISGGRVSLVAGSGYAPQDLEMAGVDPKRRGALLEETIETMRKAWTGEPFEWQGRTVRVTPTPKTKPHPLILMAGSSKAAARRAARLHLPFFPAIGDPELEAVYREESERVGYTGGFTLMPKGPGFVHVAEDPDAAWEQIAPYAWYDAQTYRSWQGPGNRSAVTSRADDQDALREEGIYRVVTPDECVALAEELGPTGSIVLHPLLCGMPVELGWESLELFRGKVLPRIKPEAG